MHWGVIVPPAISFVLMIGSLVGWLLARKSKQAAAEHERRAVEAAEAAAGHEKRSADAAERSAAAAEAQERRVAEQLDATEADPWIVEPIPSDPDVYLVNRSPTPKYLVTVSGFKVHGQKKDFQMIGPAKGVEIGHHAHHAP
jgi:hypothetical protein